MSLLHNVTARNNVSGVSRLPVGHRRQQWAMPVAVSQLPVMARSLLAGDGCQWHQHRKVVVNSHATTTFTLYGHNMARHRGGRHRQGHTAIINNKVTGRQQAFAVRSIARNGECIGNIIWLSLGRQAITNAILFGYRGRAVTPATGVSVTGGNLPVASSVKVTTSSMGSSMAMAMSPG